MQKIYTENLWHVIKDYESSNEDRIWIKGQNIYVKILSTNNYWNDKTSNSFKINLAANFPINMDPEIQALSC